MPVQHKFLNHDWMNGFFTENAILKTDFYKPEVLIIGTNNPDTPNANFADFFYGRNYFWPAFKNLSNGNFEISTRRMPSNGAPILPLNPTTFEIFELCKQFKFSFADLISNVLVTQNQIDFLPNDNIVFQGQEYNLINDNARDGIGGLAELNQFNEVEWNTDRIIEFLCLNPQIKYVYFSRQPTGIWEEHWNQIIQSKCAVDKVFSVIYTPSGNALTGSPRMNALMRHWLFNEANNYDTLNHQWLQNCGVNINNFNL